MHQQARRTSEATSPNGNFSSAVGLKCTLSYDSNIGFFPISHNIKIEKKPKISPFLQMSRGKA
jgi:hypothetical protein